MKSSHPENIKLFPLVLILLIVDLIFLILCWKLHHKEFLLILVLMLGLMSPTLSPSNWFSSSVPFSSVFELKKNLICLVNFPQEILFLILFPQEILLKILLKFLLFLYISCYIIFFFFIFHIL